MTYLLGGVALVLSVIVGLFIAAHVANRNIRARQNRIFDKLVAREQKRAYEETLSAALERGEAVEEARMRAWRAAFTLALDLHCEADIVRLSDGGRARGRYARERIEPILRAGYREAKQIGIGTFRTCYDTFPSAEFWNPLMEQVTAGPVTRAFDKI